MLDTAIQKIVCQAVVSDVFRARLLGSEREDVLRSSGLDAAEQEALLSIRADTIEEFAAGVERVVRQARQAGSRSDPWESPAVRGWLAMELPPRSG
jgi:hypothetical protein